MAKRTGDGRDGVAGFGAGGRAEKVVVLVQGRVADHGSGEGGDEMRARVVDELQSAVVRRGRVDARATEASRRRFGGRRLARMRVGRDRAADLQDSTVRLGCAAQEGGSSM